MYFLSVISLLLLVGTSESSNQEVRIQRLERLVLQQQDALYQLSRKVKNNKEIPNVAFLVNYNGPQIFARGTMIIPYNRVFFNYGGGYNLHTHAFTAPVSGLYVFHVNGLSGEKDYGCIDLWLNGRHVTRGFAANIHSTIHISTALSLNKGDKVMAKTCFDANLDNDTGNSFSGYILRTY